MRLWTYQNKGVELTEGDFNSRKYSFYYNDPSFPKAKPAYEKLWNELGTERVLWCFTEKREAISEASKLEFKDHVLWELDVPEDKYLKIVCLIAWHWIIKGGECAVPNSFRVNLRQQATEQGIRFIELEKQFHSHWANKLPEQLWKMLFIGKVTEWECSTVLLQHPVDKSWICKRDNYE